MNSKILILILILAGGIVYSFNLDNELFWDDTDWIVNNPYVHALTLENARHWFTDNVLSGVGLTSNYYRPILMASFAVNYALHGTAPLGYHLVNNLLHIANGLMLFLLLLRLFQKRSLAFWVSLVFVLHPLQTEAVTYVSGRGDPLQVFFMFLALIVWRRTPWISWILLALALLSHEKAIIFPFLALLYEGIQGGSLRRSLVRTLPFFGIVAAYGILRLTVLNLENTLNFFSQSNLYAESLWVRLLTFLSVLTVYARLLVAPTGLHMERDVAVMTSLVHWRVLVPLAAFIVIGWVMVRHYRRHSPSYPLWLFSVGWFFAALAPTSGITPINARLYEHWLYLPLVGPATLAMWYLAQLRARQIILAGAAVVLVWFAVIGIRRNILWGKPIPFFESILQYEPNRPRIMNNLAGLYYDHGEEAQAEEYYRRAIEAGTGFPQPYYNLSRILRQRGDLRGALVFAEQAVEKDPRFPFGYQEIAVIAASQGDFVKAKTALLKVIELLPADPRGYLNLAKVELAMGNEPAAREALLRGLPHASRDPEAKAEMEVLLNH